MPLNLFLSRGFFPLFTTQFLGAFNDNIFKNALLIFITYRMAVIWQMDAQILVTLSAGLFILPFLLFSATAGALADKYSKANLIVFIKIAEIFIALLAGVAFYLANLYLLLLVLILLGIHSAFFGPLKYAILPDILQPSELMRGNSLIEAGTFTAILLGTLVGSTIILHIEGKKFISLLLIIFAVLGAISSLFIPRGKQFSPHLEIRFNILKDTFKLMLELNKSTDCRITILAISWFWVLGATFMAQFPLLSKGILHTNEYVVTFFLILFTVGVGIGSLLSNLLYKGKVNPKYICYSALGMSLCIFDFYWTCENFHPFTGLGTFSEFIQSLEGIHLSLDLIGIAMLGGLYTVPLYTLLQTCTDPNFRARTIACNNIYNALFMVLSTIFTIGLFKLNVSLPKIFLLLALTNAWIAFYVLKLL